VTTHHNIKLSVLLSAVTAGQLAASVGMQWFALASLGAGVETDALLAGMTLPLLCITLGAESLAFILTPTLATRTEPTRRAFVWRLLATVGIVSVAAATVLGAAAPFLMRIMVPGFDREGQALAVLITRIQLGTIAGAAWFAVLAGLCQARGQFLRAPLAALACLLLGWAVLVLRLHIDGVLLAAWMQVLVYIGPPLLLLPAAGWPTFAQSDAAEQRALWDRLRPVLSFAGYSRSGFVVDRCLASFAAPGSLAILDLGQRMHGAAVRVMNEALVTPHVSTLARHAASGQWAAVQTAYADQRARVAAASAGFACIIVATAAVGHTWLPFFASNPQAADTIRRLLPVLVCLFGIAATASLSHNLTAAFYAIGDTHTPSTVGAAMFTVGLFAKIAGAMAGGLQGIALAITASHICNWLALEYVWARRFAGPLPVPSVAPTYTA
jgi:peptidoglycan biosynthesis protein MviN/MurJ (putative lipid II flippase)